MTALPSDLMRNCTCRTDTRQQEAEKGLRCLVCMASLLDEWNKSDRWGLCKPCSTVKGDGYTVWMSDEAIAAALSQTCVVCGMGAGFECIHEDSGKPLMEVKKRPVHAKRLEP